MEAILGPVVAIVLSFGYTEVRLRKQRQSHTALSERVETMETNLGRNMLASMIPMSKAVKELQETVGMR